MRLELEPAQPEAVVQAVASLLGAGERPVDPWWEAGIDEALGESGAVFDDVPDAWRPGPAG